MRFGTRSRIARVVIYRHVRRNFPIGKPVPPFCKSFRRNRIAQNAEAFDFNFTDIAILHEERWLASQDNACGCDHDEHRSEEHTSALQSLMRISYAVFCLKKKKQYK